MSAIGVRVDETDGHRFVPFRCDGFDYLLSGSFVERNQHFAPGIEALRNRVTILTLNERCRQHDVEVVLLEAAFGASLDDVAETIGGNKSSLRAVALDERIGRQGRAVDDLFDLSQVDGLLTDNLFDALQDSGFGAVLVRGEDLGGLERTIGQFDDNVGKRAANVGTDAVTPMWRLNRSLGFRH